jgi:hypothetical protein
MIDVAVEIGLAAVTLGCINLLRSLKQAVWPRADASLLQLPHGSALVRRVKDIAELQAKSDLKQFLKKNLSEKQAAEIDRVIKDVPKITSVSLKVGDLDVQGDSVEVSSGCATCLNVEMGVTAHSSSLSSRFHKAQTHGWLVMLARNGEVVCFKRISTSARAFRLDFEPCPGEYHFGIYSDGYHGIDFERSFQLKRS